MGPTSIPRSLTPNVYAWTNPTWMLYIKQPHGTGIGSGGPDPTNETDVGRDHYHFLHSSRNYEPDGCTSSVRVTLGCTFHPSPTTSTNRISNGCYNGRRRRRRAKTTRDQPTRDWDREWLDRRYGPRSSGDRLPEVARDDRYVLVTRIPYRMGELCWRCNDEVSVP
jgi:hypothetical protein